MNIMQKNTKSNMAAGIEVSNEQIEDCGLHDCQI
jgi:hypothetical protein